MFVSGVWTRYLLDVKYKNHCVVPHKDIKYPFRFHELITHTRIGLTLAAFWLFIIIFDIIPFFTTSQTISEFLQKENLG